MIRFRAGWLIPQQVLALTHFLPEVTMADFEQITQDTQTALAQVEGQFHLIIDNRIIENTNLATLETMLQFSPQLNHPQLRWIVMILPKALKDTAVTMKTQQHQQIRLKHVATLPEAIEFLRSVDEIIIGTAQAKGFFEP